MNDNWEIDQTVNNSDLYEPELMDLVDLDTLELIIAHIARRANNYENARDLEDDYHRGARYESMRESMEILHTDLVNFRGRIKDNEFFIDETS